MSNQLIETLEERQMFSAALPSSLTLVADNSPVQEVIYNFRSVQRQKTTAVFINATGRVKTGGEVVVKVGLKPVVITGGLGFTLRVEGDYHPNNVVVTNAQTLKVTLGDGPDTLLAYAGRAVIDGGGGNDNIRLATWTPGASSEIQGGLGWDAIAYAALGGPNDAGILPYIEVYGLGYNYPRVVSNDRDSIADHFRLLQPGFGTIHDRIIRFQNAGRAYVDCGVSRVTFAYAKLIVAPIIAGATSNDLLTAYDGFTY